MKKFSSTGIQKYKNLTVGLLLTYYCFQNIDKLYLNSIKRNIKDPVSKIYEKQDFTYNEIFNAYITGIKNFYYDIFK